MIVINIDDIDRSSVIEFDGSFQKNDIINNQVDTLAFNIIYHPGQTFRPQTNSTINVFDTAVPLTKNISFSIAGSYYLPPIEPGVYSASQLAALAANITTVSKYVNGTWVSHVKGVPINDFSIDETCFTAIRIGTSGSVSFNLDTYLTIFAGKIISVIGDSQSNGTIKYSVRCQDHSYDFNRLLVNEGFENTSVEDIIKYIVDNYCPGFTYANVSCTLIVTNIIFKRTKPTDCFKKLADATGYSFYIDYNYGVHFFEKNTEAAPFNLTDGDGNYILDSLNLSNDFSQLRNRVFIQGGEVEGESRSEYFNGDGTKKQFKLSNKFSKVPTVTVGGVSKTVGVDYIDNEDDFDCFWDYNQQYVRFKDTTIPGAGTNNIVATGLPLYNITIEVEEPTSIANYGVFEWAKTDKTIKSRWEATNVAKTQIQAYKDGLIEGSFQTYTAGLRSGQIININSVLFGVNESFLIQSVNFTQVSRELGIYKVNLATLRTINLIDFLISQLRAGEQLIEDTGETVIEKTLFPLETVSVGDTIGINVGEVAKNEEIDIDETLNIQAINFPVIFVAGPYQHDPTSPTDYKRVFIADGSPAG